MSRDRGRVVQDGRDHPAARAFQKRMEAREPALRVQVELAWLRALLSHVDPRSWPLPKERDALETRLAKRLSRLSDRQRRPMEKRAWRLARDTRQMKERFGRYAAVKLSSGRSVASQVEALNRRSLPEAPRELLRREPPPTPERFKLLPQLASQAAAIPLVPIVVGEQPAIPLEYDSDNIITHLQQAQDVSWLQEGLQASLAIQRKVDSLAQAGRPVGDSIGGQNRDGDWFWRLFTHGAIYCHVGGRTVAVMGQHPGVYWCYLGQGLLDGPLGAPMTDTRYEDGGQWACFEGGIILKAPNAAAVPLTAWPVAARWIVEGRADGPMGWLESTVPYEAADGSTAQGFRFERADAWYHPEFGSVALVPDGPLAVAARQSVSHAGIPIADPRDCELTPWRVLACEAGAIYHHPDTDETRAVWGAAWEAYLQGGGIAALGPPSSNLAPTAHGCLVLRVGERVVVVSEGQAFWMHEDTHSAWVDRYEAYEDPGRPIADEQVRLGAGCSTSTFENGAFLRAEGQPLRWLSQVIMLAWLERGGADGPLGWPLDDEQVYAFAYASTDEPNIPASTTVRRLDRLRCPGGEVFAQGIRAFVLEGPFAERWVQENKTIGLPTSSSGPADYSPSGAYPPGDVLRCERGALVADPWYPSRIYLVSLEMLDRWMALGGTGGDLGAPTGDRRALIHPDQGFIGWALPCERGSLWQPYGSGDLHATWGLCEEGYREVEGPVSWLGWPLQDTQAEPDGGQSQRFEQGRLLPGAFTFGCLRVPEPIWGEWTALGGFEGQLGAPVDHASPTSDGFIQPFQGGTMVQQGEEVSAHHLDATLQLVLERITCHQETGQDPGADELALVVVGIGADQKTRARTHELGPWESGQNEEVHRVVLEMPVHQGPGWPKGYAALLTPLDMDYGDLLPLAQDLLDATEGVVQQAADDTSAWVASVASGGIPPLAWVLDHFISEFTGRIVAGIFEGVVSGLAHEVLPTMPVSLTLYQWNNLGAVGDSWSSPVSNTHFEGHGGSYSFTTRWRVQP